MSHRAKEMQWELYWKSTACPIHVPVNGSWLAPVVHVACTVDLDVDELVADVIIGSNNNKKKNGQDKSINEK